MNTNQFTYRDFITYFLSGIIFIISAYLSFSDWCSIEWLEKDSTEHYLAFFDTFKILTTISLIAIIYLVGHVIHWFDFLIMKLYVKLYKLNNRYKFKVIFLFRKIIERVLYRHRVTYQISTFLKKEANTPFKSNDEFWIVCAELQLKNQYGSCEYWYSLNDLFKGIYLIFLINLFISIVKSEYFITLILLVLTIATYWRARQFAKYFVDTVVRTKKAEKR